MTERIVEEKLKLTQELERSKYFQLDLWPVEFTGNTLNLLRSCRLGSLFAAQLGGFNWVKCWLWEWISWVRRGRKRYFLGKLIERLWADVNHSICLLRWSWNWDYRTNSSYTFALQVSAVCVDGRFSISWKLTLVCISKEPECSPQMKEHILLPLFSPCWLSLLFLLVFWGAQEFPSYFMCLCYAL